MRDTIFRVTNLRTGRVVAGRVRRASSFFARSIGLLGRRGLEAGHGLWIEPCSSIHMFFMRFAIDAVFLDARGRVTRLFADLRPWRIAFGGLGARSVIELPVGAIEASRTRPGDRLELEPAS